MPDHVPPPYKSISAMPAGRALDGIVAERVLGWTKLATRLVRGVDVPDQYMLFGVPPDCRREQLVPWLSTDMEDAWAMVTRLHRHHGTTRGYGDFSATVAFHLLNDPGGAPRLICLAALRCFVKE